MKNRLYKCLNTNLKSLFRLLFIFSFITLTIYNAYCIKGNVMDNYGKIIPYATVKYIDQSNNANVYVGKTDALGNYSIDAPLINYQDGTKGFILFDIYPNPTTNGIVIPLNLINSGYLLVYIYNTYGERVNTIYEGNYSSGLYQLIWDGRTNVHQRVAPGIYFVQIIFNGRTECRKVVLMENNGNVVTPIPINNFLNILESYKIKYTVTITCDSLIDQFYLPNYDIMKSDSNNFVVQKHVPIPYKVIGNYIAVYNVDSNSYKKIFLKGINIADGVPGTYPGDLSVDAPTYRWWLDSIGNIGFNCIRAYTLHRPQFYDEILRYNNLHLDNPLYLMQGIWLDEDTITNLHANFYKYSDGFDSDVKEVIDCVHGKKVIAPRPGKAYGDYTTDVSRWVIGYIEGREIYGAEILANDSINSSHFTYVGSSNNIVLPSGTPSECWMAERLDHLVGYERTTYHNERPVSFSSWPTLDPLDHKIPGYTDISQNDIVSVDLNKLVMKNAPAGFFLTYHVYPYYPFFISGTGAYQQYSDSIGPFPYMKYIEKLKNYYTNYPTFIAEYGVPASWGNAKSAYAGLNDGQLDETQQGNMEVRMLKSIYSEGCLGGCLFEWIDEFFKNKWIIEPTSCSIDRRILWHNVVNPEQTFGMLKFVEDPPTYTNWQDFIPPSTSVNTRISKVQTAYDNEFFYTKVYFDFFSNNDTMYVGYDTYNPSVGESAFPIYQGIVNMNNEAEFLLKITKDSANLYVTRAYDTYWDIHHGDSNRVYHSISTTNDPWKIVRWKTDQMDTSISYPGRLRSCKYTDNPTSINAVVHYNDHVEIRIPWHILNFTDPSNREVLNCVTCKGNDLVRPHSPPISQLDNSGLPKETAYTDGIALNILYANQTTYSYIETGRYLWAPWGLDQYTGVYTPPTPLKVEMKKNAQIFKNLFQYNLFNPY